MFKGSNVALVTPFKNNKLDEDTYIKLIHFHIKNGTNGWPDHPPPSPDRRLEF